MAVSSKEIPEGPPALIAHKNLTYKEMSSNIFQGKKIHSKDLEEHCPTCEVYLVAGGLLLPHSVPHRTAVMLKVV